MSNQLAFYFNAQVCTACKVCQIACQDKNNLPEDIRWRRVLQYGGGSWISQDGFLVPNNVTAYSISFACMHCEKAVCMEVCPVSAISKRDDGVVLIDQAKCIGCRYCQWACPYGAPQFREDLGVMTKCTFCEDLLAQGQNPACVDACVMRCLDFGNIDELRQKYGNMDAIEPLPTADITKPSLVITAHKHAQMSGKGTGRILNLPEEL